MHCVLWSSSIQEYRFSEMKKDDQLITWHVTNQVISLDLLTIKTAFKVFRNTFCSKTIYIWLCCVVLLCKVFFLSIVINTWVINSSSCNLTPALYQQHSAAVILPPTTYNNTPATAATAAWYSDPPITAPNITEEIRGGGGVTASPDTGGRAQVGTGATAI